MRTLARVVLLLALTAAACAQEPAPAAPAPDRPSEPQATAAQTGIDPRAGDIVRQMSALLQGASSLAVEAEEAYDEVPEHQPRTLLTNLRHAAVRRPNRFVGDASGDAVNRSFWYDGRTLSLLDKEQNTYATMRVPATIDGALDAVFERTGIVVPIADFFFEDVYGRLMANAQRGVYLGLHSVEGVMCHHLSFQQELIDWQLWVDAGEQPLPRKLVIVYKTEYGVPQYAVIMRKWNLKAELPDELFQFVPPEGAGKMEFPAGAGSSR